MKIKEEQTSCCIRSIQILSLLSSMYFCMAVRRIFSGVDLRNLSFTEGTVYMTKMVIAMMSSTTTIMAKTRKN